MGEVLMGEALNEILDNISQGVIVIDTKGIITTYNKKAKEIFGIFESTKISHKSDKLKKDDLVFIVDNKVGEDDGELDYKSFEKIGIYDKNLKKGDSILAFGTYKSSNNHVNENYKIIEVSDQSGEVYLDGVYRELKYKLSIDYSKKILEININDTIYIMNYRYAVGHMVIIRNNELVFYQSKGYTARNESLRYILEERVFREKGKNAQAINPIGDFIFNVHERNNEMDKFYRCATKEDNIVTNEFMNINGIATLSSIIPLYSEENKIGAILRVEDITELKEVIEERNVLLKNLKKTEKLLEDENIARSFKKFQGVSAHINDIKKIAYKSSKTDSTVLILGESGTGKSTLAEEIHNISNRKDNKFLHINCASLPESLLESELFGYEGGAFTNSRKSGKPGLFELANNGTVFLDEIGEMPLKIQGKLLNFLQNKTFYRIGGIEEIKVDTRIICATNKNLEQLIKEKEFREDLYYRINIIPIYIEPLRNRIEDIPLLVDKLIENLSKKLKKEPITMTREAMNKLMCLSWLGNIRELENVLERTISLNDSNVIYSKDILVYNTKNETKEINESLKVGLEEAEKKIIINCLRAYKGNIKACLNILEVGKTSFYDKLKKYNININDYR
ncbi:MAG TPA: sigma-54-dependent Fis family transcriptional regulator [Clostridium sp.]|nr:sigma-54-dependent Fis family transcriptional regulator [Clostridium sp.]